MGKVSRRYDRRWFYVSASGIGKGVFQMSDQIAKFTKLLEEASRISINPSRTKNYFEVAGYPHYENVASSILSFYFDTNEEHGLKDLWLKSLMECYRNKSDSDELDSIFSLGHYETVEGGVAREEVTQDLKRLDIVIPTNNDFVVAIENKIYADIYNPFESYSKWINQHFEQYTNILEIVLSLNPVSNAELLVGTDSNGNNYNFVNITYKELIAAVQKNIGSYLPDSNEKWLIYMNEFIKNIDSLQEGSMELNKEWQAFIDNNNTLISEYYRKTKEDQKAKIELVKKFADMLQGRFDNEATTLHTRVATFGHQSFASHISLVIDIFKDENTTIVIEPYFMKDGAKLDEYQHLGVLYVAIWVRNKKYRDEGLSFVEDILRRNQIPYIKRSNKDWGDSFEVKQFDYSKDVNNQDVEDYVFDLWKIISADIKSDSD